MNNDDDTSLGHKPSVPPSHQPKGESRQSLLPEDDKNTPDPKDKRKGDKEESWLSFLSQFVIVIVVIVFIRSFVIALFNIPSASMIPTLQIGDTVAVSKFSYGYSRYSLPFSPDIFSGRLMARQPHRGDVAVFRYTQNTSVDYIKRIVGLPGDHIKVVEGRLYINGEELPRKYIGHYEIHDEAGRLLSGERYKETLPASPHKTLAEGSDQEEGVTHDVLKLTDEGQANNTPDYVVPQGCFFAMGDDRDDSSDSRFHGGREVGQCAAPAGNDYLQMSGKDLGFVPMENLIGRADFVMLSFDMRHPAWAFWYWPFEIRWGRIFHHVQ